jgi:hypothetical protein
MWYNEVNGVKQINKKQNKKGTYLDYTFRRAVNTSPTSPHM